MRYQEMTIEGRNAVTEALRSGRPIDRLFIQDHCQDGPVLTIRRLARAKDIPVKYVEKERLDQLSVHLSHLFARQNITPLQPLHLFLVGTCG